MTMNPEERLNNWSYSPSEPVQDVISEPIEIDDEEPIQYDNNVNCYHMYIDPQEELDRWSVTCCYGNSGGGGDTYTKEEIDAKFKDTNDKVNDLAVQVSENTQKILNTYTKQETNDLLAQYLTKIEARHIVANYAAINGTKLILNNENIS